MIDVLVGRYPTSGEQTFDQAISTSNELVHMITATHVHLSTIPACAIEHSQLDRHCLKKAIVFQLDEQFIRSCLYIICSIVDIVLSLLIE
jgi:hypothetical protein